jgi:hypothetical protein
VATIGGAFPVNQVFQQYGVTIVLDIPASWAAAGAPHRDSARKASEACAREAGHGGRLHRHGGKRRGIGGSDPVIIDT